MEIFTAGNLLAWNLQICCLTALATAVAAVVRVDSGAIRYAYWRAVLTLSLLLPWLLQPLRRAATATAATATEIVATATPQMDLAGPVGSSAAAIDWLPVVSGVLLLGIAVRILWIAAGITSLRRLRELSTSVPHELAAEIAALQDTIGTRADVRCVSGLTQPATFGVVRPVVLLPDAARDQPMSIQRALLAHELFHVRRRDWLWVVCEEVLLAALWFNPAVWWTVAQLRRTREEAVDELAILAIGSRRTYVRALLAFAHDAALAPAPAFAQRRHLFRRITLISREAVMSSSRVVASGVVMGAMLLSGSFYAASAFPLVSERQSQGRETPGQMELRAKPVTRDNPVPRRTDFRAPDYPVEARVLGLNGGVHMKVTIDEVGRVAEVRRTAYNLHIEGSDFNASFHNTSEEAVRSFIDKALINRGRVTLPPADSIVRALNALGEAAATAVSQWRYEPPVDGPLAFDVRVVFKSDGETLSSQIESLAGPRTSQPAVSAIHAPGAVRVGGEIKAPMKIRDVRPAYPPMAQAARVSGMVIIEALIGREGDVEQAKVLRSIPLLDQAALDAVYLWKFTPTLLNGAPVPVIMTVTVNFTVQ